MRTITVGFAWAWVRAETSEERAAQWDMHALNELLLERYPAWSMCLGGICVGSSPEGGYYIRRG